MVSCCTLCTWAVQVFIIELNLCFAKSLSAAWVAGEGVDPAVMNEVAKMVAQSCSTCSKAMRAEGVQVTLCLTSRCLSHVSTCFQLGPQNSPSLVPSEPTAYTEGFAVQCVGGQSVLA